MNKLFLAAALFATAPIWAQWQLVPTGTDASLRGLAAISARVAWATGTKGSILRTADGGATWTKHTPPGQEDSDFRDIQAFSADEALALSIGPGPRSKLWRTANAGASWELLATNKEAEGFWDAIAFFDRNNGLLLGDPVGNRFTLLRTTDGGRNWTRIMALPVANEKEGAFAASGTCLITHGTRDAWFITGGSAGARVFHSRDQGQTWSVSTTPLRHDAAESGAFSIATKNGKHLLLVGGHYRLMEESIGVAAYSKDRGKSWNAFSANGPTAYRSAVAFSPKAKTVWATGPTGTDRSVDGGTRWQAFSKDGFHTLQIAPDGTVWAAGSNGRVARILP